MLAVLVLVSIESVYCAINFIGVEVSDTNIFRDDISDTSLHINTDADGTVNLFCMGSGVVTSLNFVPTIEGIKQFSILTNGIKKAIKWTEQAKGRNLSFSKLIAKGEVLCSDNKINIFVLEFKASKQSIKLCIYIWRKHGKSKNKIRIKEPGMKKLLGLLRKAQRALPVFVKEQYELDKEFN